MIRRLLRRIRPAQTDTRESGAPPKASAPRPRPQPTPKHPTHVPSPDQARSLVLYKYDACPYCARVQRALPELGLPVTLRDTREDPEARQTLREISGGTQVPCLVIDGVPLLESLDILAWLRAHAEQRPAEAP